jgi:hypothetical protein
MHTHTHTHTRSIGFLELCTYQPETSGKEIFCPVRNQALPSIFKPETPHDRNTSHPMPLPPWRQRKMSDAKTNSPPKKSQHGGLTSGGIYASKPVFPKGCTGKTLECAEFFTSAFLCYYRRTLF